MKLIVQLTLVSLALATRLSSQGPDSEVQMLFASDYFPNQVSARTGETWYGLFPSGHQWRLEATRIRVELLNTGCIENGRRVTVDRPELRFVRVVDGRSQLIVAFHSPNDATQIAWPPRILWIGDLDRDGRPDFFADIHMFETPGDWVLYLSSAATPKPWPRKAALVPYLMGGLKANANLLAELGPHRVGGGYLYLPRLEEVDTTVLTRLIRQSHKGNRRVTKRVFEFVGNLCGVSAAAGEGDRDAPYLARGSEGLQDRPL